TNQRTDNITKHWLPPNRLGAEAGLRLSFSLVHGLLGDRQVALELLEFGAEPLNRRTELVAHRVAERGARVTQQRAVLQHSGDVLRFLQRLLELLLALLKYLPHLFDEGVIHLDFLFSHRTPRCSLRIQNYCLNRALASGSAWRT